jgi:hypothetical protein
VTYHEHRLEQAAQVYHLESDSLSGVVDSSPIVSNDRKPPPLYFGHHSTEGRRMRIAILTCLLAALALPAFADSIRFGDKLLIDGDSAAKVRQIAGTPDNVEPIQNQFGATLGERWQYYRDGKTITITIENGKVTAITETR